MSDLFSASSTMPKLQRIYGCVWTALQNGTRIYESSDRNCIAVAEEVSEMCLIFSVPLCVFFTQSVLFVTIISGFMK